MRGRSIVAVTVVFLCAIYAIQSSKIKTKTISEEQKSEVAIKSLQINPKNPQAYSVEEAQKHDNPSKVIYIRGMRLESLLPEEEKEFFESIYEMFVSDKVPYDDHSVRIMLTKLNKFRNRAVGTIAEILEDKPMNSDSYQMRFAIAEYLSYRLKWDDESKNYAEKYLAEQLDTGLPLDVYAMKIQEKVIVATSMARFFPESVEMISSFNKSVEKERVAMAFELGLMNAGYKPDNASQILRSFWPDY